MPLSFTPNETFTQLKPTSPHRVLVTGAGGRIGSYYAEHAPAHHERRLMVRPGDPDAQKLAADPKGTGRVLLVFGTFELM